MINILEAPFIKEIQNTTSNMYRLGWNERNGGNISMLLSEEELIHYLDLTHVIREIPLSVPCPELAGRYFIITGTGKYFKNIKENPSFNLGIIRISADGKTTELIWGYEDGGRFTSEITMHLGAHIQRLHVDSEHRVVMHAHPTNLIAMTHIHELDEKEFTKSLWRTCTECIVIFPDGVAVLPWMVSSSDSIGLASSKKFHNFRVLVWGLHGLTVTGRTLDEAFGLAETVEKAAEIYMKTASFKIINHFSDDMLKSVVEDFKLEIKDGWL